MVNMNFNKIVDSIAKAFISESGLDISEIEMSVRGPLDIDDYAYTISFRKKGEHENGRAESTGTQRRGAGRDESWEVSETSFSIRKNAKSSGGYDEEDQFVC